MVLDVNEALGLSLRGLFCVFPAQERDEHVVDQDGFYWDMQHPCTFASHSLRLGTACLRWCLCNAMSGSVTDWYKKDYFYGWYYGKGKNVEVGTFQVAECFNYIILVFIFLDITWC